DLVLVGVERSSIRAIASRIATSRRRVIVSDPDPSHGSFFRSDHFPFARLGIPAVSTGLPTDFIGAGRMDAERRRDAFTTRDYHQPSDEVRDDWDYEGAAEDARLLAELVWTLADAPESPAYLPGRAIGRAIH